MVQYIIINKERSEAIMAIMIERPYLRQHEADLNLIFSSPTIKMNSNKRRQKEVVMTPSLTVRKPLAVCSVHRLGTNVRA
jgi:hypothetical protein